MGIREKLWNDRYQQLTNFREKFGHCNVDRKEYAKLAGWITHLRTEYKKYQNGEQCSMTQDRIEKLQAIDFCFNVYQQKWENHLKQVLEFKSRYGHCRIPRKYQPNLHLGEWVRYVRSEYKRYEQGKKCSLKKKQVDDLMSIDFFAEPVALDTAKEDYIYLKNENRMNTKLWNVMYQQLLKFKTEHGHCIVRQKDPEYSKLGTWVVTQRETYKRCINGKTDSISQDRMDKLKAIGFCFEVHDALWEEHLQNLEEFKRLHGHVHVPYSYPPNQRLSNWARHCRQKYRLYLNGKRKESRLTKARVDSLERIGFQPYYANIEDAPGPENTRTRSAGVKRTHGEHSNDAPSSQKPRTRYAIVKTGEGISRGDLPETVVSLSLEREEERAPNRRIEDKWNSIASISCPVDSLSCLINAQEDIRSSSQKPISRPVINNKRRKKEPLKDEWQSDSSTSCSFPSHSTSDNEKENDEMASQESMAHSATSTRKRLELVQQEIRHVLQVVDSKAAIVSSTLEGSENEWEKNAEDKLGENTSTSSSFQSLRTNQCQEEPDYTNPSWNSLTRCASARKREEMAQPETTTIIVSSPAGKQKQKQTAEDLWNSDASSSSSSSLQNLVTNDEDEDGNTEDDASSCSFQNLGANCNEKDNVEISLQRPRTHPAAGIKRRHEMVQVNSIRRQDKWGGNTSTLCTSHDLSTSNEHEDVDDEDDDDDVGVDDDEGSFICIV